MDGVADFVLLSRFQFERVRSSFEPLLAPCGRPFGPLLAQLPLRAKIVECCSVQLQHARHDLKNSVVLCSFLFVVSVFGRKF